jgi:hypothetical protein
MNETKPKIVVDQVKPEHLDQVWPHVTSLIERALEFNEGRFDLRYVYNSVALQTQTPWYLWVAFDREKAEQGELDAEAAIVTCLSDWPTGLRVAEILLAGGRDKVDTWLPHFDILRRWAIANKCDRLQIIGRSGWGKRLKAFGIESRSVVTMFEHDLQRA